MRPDSPASLLNRELTWLEFNARVLAEAETLEVPLLERLKFAAIVSNNLDEFFMVRVAILHRAIDAGSGPLRPEDAPPARVLAQVSENAQRLVDRQSRCFCDQLVPAMAAQRIEIVRPPDYTPADMEVLTRHFDEQLSGILTPLAVDEAHPFPLVTNCTVYILFKVRPSADADRSLFYGHTDTLVVEVPRGQPRLIALPASEGGVRVALVDDVIVQCASTLMRGYEVEGACGFRVTRDADTTVDEEQVDDLLVAIEKEVRSRRWGRPIRLEVDARADQSMISYLKKRLEVSEDDTYRITSMLDLRCLLALVGMIRRPDLENPPWHPQPHPLLDRREDIFEAIRDRDILFHHPYHSFDPIVDLVARAAGDQDVLSIKMTLYRVAGRSPIVNALARAAEAGKQVTVLVELRARFDEEANIEWARKLDGSGAHVIYGVVGYKTHAKALLIVRKERDGLRRYVHLSTGNYNDRTARLYTDIGYMTARSELGADISSFFNVITGYSLPPRWQLIEMAPTGLRRRLLALIEREVEKHSAETPGHIRAKMNSLTDPAVIRALYRASTAGVKVDLVVRGMCRLRPGVEGLSDHIGVVSVIDRFLEHSRIWHFRNGGSDEVYLTSADWMERNLGSRLELMFPVLDAPSRLQVLRVIDVALQDTTKAWIMMPDGTYLRAPRKGRARARRSQEMLYREACRAAAKPASRSGRVFQVRRKPGEERVGGRRA